MQEKLSQLTETDEVIGLNIVAFSIYPKEWVIIADTESLAIEYTGSIPDDYAVML